LGSYFGTPRSPLPHISPGGGTAQNPVEDFQTLRDLAIAVRYFVGSNSYGRLSVFVGRHNPFVENIVHGM
jgi:hypothetical protein